MKVNRKEFLAALTMAARVAPKTSPKPILQNVVLETIERMLHVRATNLETYFSTGVTCDGTLERVLVNTQSARNLVKELAGDTVDVLAVPGGLNATIGGATLVGDGPDMFPEFPELVGGVGFDIPAGEFRGMIENVRYAAAREESRYMINGLLVELKNGALRMVATDGRRLAIAKLDAGAGLASMIIPLDAVNALRMNISKSKEMLHVDVDDSWVRFSWGANVMTVRTLEARFPDYRSVIPAHAPIIVYVERAPLIAALKRLKPFWGRDLPLVTFDVREGALIVSAERSGVGSDSVDVDAIIDGQGKIGFAADYLLDGLKASDQDSIRLRFTDGETPALFDLGFTYVLMPIGGV